MSNLIIVLILVAILGGAAAYVSKAKKSGCKCIGCPEGCCPSAKKSDQGESPCSCCCGCGGTSEEV